MKKPGIFLKITVVSVFVLLLSAFVAYRAGAFDTSGNLISANDLSSADSPVTDSVTIDRGIDVMSSSKSGGVFYPDTAKPQQQQQAPNQTNKPKNPGNNANNATGPQIMHSSKSAPVFTPRTDTSKPQK